MVGMLRRHTGLLLGSGLLTLAILGLSSWLLREPALLHPTDPAGGAASGVAAAAADAYVCRVVDEEGKPCAGVQVGAWLAPALEAVGRFVPTDLAGFRSDPPLGEPAPDVTATTDDDGLAHLVGLDHERLSSLRPLVEAPRIGMLHRPPSSHLFRGSEAPRPRAVLRVERGQEAKVRVVDGRGQGVPAFVRAHWSPPRGERWRGEFMTLPWGRCDDAGRRSLGPLPSGSALMDVSLPGVGYRERVRVESDGAGEQVVALRVRPGARVEGRVRTTDGASIAGAVVVLCAQARERDPSGDRWCRIAVTDAEGRYHVEGLPEGSLAGSFVECPGYVTRLDVGDYLPLDAEQPARLDVQLAKACTFVGRTCTPDGAPCAGVPLRARYEFVRGATLAVVPTLPPQVQVVSDEEGRFRLEGLPATVVSVEPRDFRTRHAGPGGEDAFTIEFHAEGEVLSGDVVVAPVPSARVEGRVIDARGDAVPDAVVTWSARRSLVASGQVGAGSDGRFVVDDLPGARDYTFRARHGELHSTPLTVTFSEEKLEAAAPIELAVRPWCRIEGQVLQDDGTPAARIKLTASRENAKSRMAHSGVNGRFTFPMLEPGTYSITARHYVQGGWSILQEVPLWQLGQSEQIEVRLPPIARVAGVLQDEAGRPLAGEQPMLHLSEPSAKRERLFLVRKFRGRDATDEQGHFAIELIWPEGAKRAKVVFDVAGVEHATPIDGPSDDLRIVVSRPPTPGNTVRVEGRVSTPDGVDLAEGMIRFLERRANEMAPVGSARVTDGRFAARLRLLGDTVIVVVDGGRDLHGRTVPFAPWMRSDVRPAAGPLDIRLTPGTRARVRVLDAEGRPVPGASVSLRQDSDAERRLRHALDRSVRGTTDSEGRFESYGFGQLTVRASVFAPRRREGSGLSWEPFTFEPGDAWVDLPAQPLRDAGEQEVDRASDGSWRHAPWLLERLAGAEVVVLAEVDPAAHTSLRVTQADPIARYRARVAAYPRAVGEAMRTVLTDHGIDRVVLVLEREIPRATMQAAVNTYLRDRDAASFQKAIFGLHRIRRWDDRRGHSNSHTYRDEDHYRCVEDEGRGREYTVGYPGTPRVVIPPPSYGDWLYRDAFAEYRMLLGLADAAADAGLPLYVYSTNAREGIHVPPAELDRQTLDHLSTHLLQGVPLVCSPAMETRLRDPASLLSRCCARLDEAQAGAHRTVVQVVEVVRAPEERSGPIGVELRDGGRRPATPLVRDE